MFDHVTIRASDREASVRFYLTVLPTLGIEQTHADEEIPGVERLLARAGRRRQPAHAAAPHRLRGTLPRARRRVLAGRHGSGLQGDGAPGPRPQYSDDYSGAFLLDPDGDSPEAVHHGTVRDGGKVDHLWIRVADLEASTRFYETVAPAAGFRRRTRAPRAGRCSPV